MVKNFVFLGVPGVGKGTIAKQIMQEQGIIHISTGNIFREHIKNQTPLGKSVKKLLALGKYVPDKITNEIVALKLQEPHIQKHGFILDGYPRTINQAQFLETITNPLNYQIVLLEASSELIAKRLAKRAQEEGRLDDTKQVITDRINIYVKKTKPLINYYDQKKQILRIKIDGTILENVAKFYRRCKFDNN